MVELTAYHKPEKFRRRGRGNSYGHRPYSLERRGRRPRICRKPADAKPPPMWRKAFINPIAVRELNAITPQISERWVHHSDLNFSSPMPLSKNFILSTSIRCFMSRSVMMEPIYKFLVSESFKIPSSNAILYWNAASPDRIVIWVAIGSPSKYMSPSLRVPNLAQSRIKPGMKFG